MLAVAAVGASSALAKEKYSQNTWTQYKHCPFSNPYVARGETPSGEGISCVEGETLPGSKGGYFTLGNVTVKLSKPVIIQGALYNDENEPGAEPEAARLIAAEGAETVESPELAVTDGLKVVTKTIQADAGWSQALKESFKEAEKNKETALYAKIEVAGGNELYENPNAISSGDLVEEERNAFELPLKVKLTNTWLDKLASEDPGSGPCEIGSEEHPAAIQDLTSAPPGRAEEQSGFKPNEQFTNIEIAGSRLVDLNWPAEEGANGCGVSYESYVDNAINLTLEFNRHQHGTTVLEGNLFTAQSHVADEELTNGHE
jgi:hypothetical protein